MGQTDLPPRHLGFAVDAHLPVYRLHLHHRLLSSSIGAHSGSLTHVVHFGRVCRQIVLLSHLFLAHSRIPRREFDGSLLSKWIRVFRRRSGWQNRWMRRRAENRREGSIRTN